MKSHFRLIFSISSVALASFTTLHAAAKQDSTIEVNGIAAKVNGQVITKNQVAFMLAPIYAQLSAQHPRRGSLFESQFQEAKQKIIQELIDRQIILDEFKQLGATIKPYIIDEEIKGQIHQLYNGSEVKFREELKRSRLTMEGYREMTLEKMVVQSMRAQQFSDAAPPLPGEVQHEYDEIKTSLRDVTKDVVSFQKIFIPSSDVRNPTATPDSQLALAENIVQQLEKGADFTALAKLHSRDAYAELGGIQKNVPRTDLTPEFAKILCDAPTGQLLGPLMDTQGFTIVKTTHIQFSPSPPLSEVRPMIEERVRRKKTSVQYENWIKSRRKRAMIDIHM